MRRGPGRGTLWPVGGTLPRHAFERQRGRKMKNLQPIVVVGGGHAGVEAAHAAARLGANVVLLTLRKDALVRLSCNPSVGGIGKSHLVREIDAMGGLVALAADLAGIHFRVLNRSRGPAVRGPRVQEDYDEYPRVMGSLLQHPRIEIIEAEATGFHVEQGRLAGVKTADGRVVPAASAVVTTGTFLRGRLFRGDEVVEGGRIGEPPSVLLHEAFVSLGIRLERFKTGTPPRLLRDSIEPERFEPQPGDPVPEPLSFVHLGPDRFEPRLPQLTTWLARTTPRVHEIVRKNLSRSALYGGRIRSRGPRYCPSFEDKVVKFPDRDQHLLHLEPMGIDHPWVYLNGFSNSMPAEIQEEMVRAIPGLEDVTIARYGYAVEYDYAPPTQLRPSLETTVLPGLFLAGQVCGTTGYEEAAALGLVAGINAVRSALGLHPFVPDRFSSYLGVLVDDLTTRGVLEPYRMFTSRAELRLSLAPDTADRRLTPLGERLGVVPRDRAARARARWERIEAALRAIEREGDLGASRPASPADRIRRGEDPEAVLREALAGLPGLGPRDRETLVNLVRYRGYLEREQREADRLRRAEAVRIPPGFPFADLPGLSTEIRQRLSEVRPRSLGQAARIPGMTPAALALLAAALGQGSRRRRETAR